MPLCVNIVNLFLICWPTFVRSSTDPLAKPVKGRREYQPAAVYCKESQHRKLYSVIIIFVKKLIKKKQIKIKSWEVMTAICDLL